MKKKDEIPEKTDGEQLTAPAAEENAAPADKAEEAAPAGEEKAPENDRPNEDEEKLARDVETFHKLFPEVDAKAIPGEVWEQVEAGESLTCAYAVHFVKALREEERIEKVNAENEKAAPPPVRHDGKEESYFSPEAVKAMSREEVRKNYQEILRSMDHWK